MFYVEYAQTIVYRSPIPKATTQEEAQMLFDQDRVDYNYEEIVGSYDDFEVLKIYEEKD